jgi:putative ABC transport system substrate-binding protein
MRRRRFVLTSLAGALAPPLAAAQETGRTYRLGGLFAGPRDAPQHVALFDELRRNGFMLGQNLHVDPRGYGLQPDRFTDVAVELVNAKVDLIICGGDPAIRAAQRASATIPSSPSPRTWSGRDWYARWAIPAATRRGSASSRLSSTASARRS